MSQRRQLAAIMFTDIEGYTATMQQNEQKAIILKDRHREVIQTEHDYFSGRIIQYYGDGTLSIFQSAVQAVECALAMQLTFRKNPIVPVRMGLHIGDIIFDEDQVFGDGVNLASRIESLGVAGSVLMSDKVYDEIHNHPKIKTVSVGSYQLKNIEREVEVFALNHAGLIIPKPNSLKGKTEEKKTSKKFVPVPALQLANFDEEEEPIIEESSKKSIAVLPFVNMSNDPEQDYFGEGIAEEILNALSNLTELKVAGRTSSFQFNKNNSSINEIGERLGVSTVLEGSVRKQGNRLRITVQLINVEDGFHLWSEKYDRNMDDIFAIQDEIALAVTEKLKGTLLDKEQGKINRNNKPDTEAYELYLKGRFYLSRRGASIVTGIQYFKQAIDIDPNFALAHAGYADANLLSAFYGLLPPTQVLYKARQSAETALNLDPTLCEPYCSLGSYYTFEWNWIDAEKNLLKSLQINPEYAQAHYWYGLNILAWIKGEFEEAEERGRIAKMLEPLSSITHAAYGAILYSAGKFEAALEECKKGLEIDAYSFLCRFYEGNSYMALEKYEEARVVYEKAMKISNRHAFAQNGLIITNSLLGNTAKAKSLMKDLKQRYKKSYVASAFTGISAAYLNDLDEAFDYLEKAYTERDPSILTLKYAYWVPENLRSDKRFEPLLKKIGFPSDKK